LGREEKNKNMKKQKNRPSARPQAETPDRNAREWQKALRESEGRFQKIVEQAPIAMAVVGMDGTIEFINRKAIKVFGYLPEDIPTMDRWWVQAYPEETYRRDVVADWTGRVQKALTKGGEITGNEYRVTCKDGSIKTMFISGVPVPEKIFVMFDDITERKRAEEELQNSKEVLELIFKISPDAAVITRLSDGMIADINERFLTISGYSRNEVVGKTSIELNLYENADSRRKIVEELGRKGYCENAETIFRTKSGGRITGIMSSQIVTLNGAPHVYSIIRDITERKRMEEALRESEERFSKAFKTSPYAYMIANMEDGAIIEINDAFTVISGVTREEALTSSTLKLNFWVNQEDRKRMVAALRGSGVVECMETQLRAKDGSIATVLLFARVIQLNRRSCILSIMEDITARKQAEEALRQSNEKFAKTFRTSPDSITITRLSDGTYLEVNQSFTDTTGFTSEEVIGRSSLPGGVALWPSREDRDRMVSGLTSRGEVIGMEAQLRMKNGTIRTALLSARILEINNEKCILTIARDITERKRMEEIIHRTTKLDSLGILAGGIAHDFNNLLAGIYGYMDMARSVSKDAQISEYLEAMLATMKRAKGLTLQLLTFAKGGSPVQKITPLIPFIQETAKFALSGSNISCRFSLAEDLRPCNIDKDQIAQVIDNIVINAQQAMPDGGVIEITATNRSFSEKDHPPLAKGDYVKVSIKDFGIGIPKEIMPRIFDPFYTTKIKGHGLGLATSYSIINRHGGCIDVESEPGKGSTFHVYLPASSEAVVSDAATASRHKGSGTIIVMDDEEVVRDTFRQMLELLGYTVICKHNGRAAVDFFISETAKRRFAAMIFDLTIPGDMGGMEAVAEIRKLDAGAPKLPIFVSSGYADNSVMKNPVEYGFTASISKPFTIADLSEMLNKYLKT
jgi:PAS domain S-box-containing protein